jgi:hypothetical protein
MRDEAGTLQGGSMLICGPLPQSTQQYGLDYYYIDFLENMNEIAHIAFRETCIIVKDGLGINASHLIAGA